MRKMKLNNTDVEAILESVRNTLLTEKLIPEKLVLDIPIDVDVQRTPTIAFTNEAYTKIIQLINATTLEIAWHGTVEYDEEEDTFTVTDIVVFPQKTTAATVDVDDDKYVSWFTELEDDVINNLRMHGHSHVNMGVSPSGVDISYQEELGKSLRDDEFYLFIIINKREEIHATLYDRGVIFDDKDLIITTPYDDYAVWADNEIAANVTKQTTISTINATNTGNTTVKGGNKSKGKKGSAAKTNTQPTEKESSVYRDYLRETKPELFGGSYYGYSDYYYD